VATRLLRYDLETVLAAAAWWAATAARVAFVRDDDTPSHYAQVSTALSQLAVAMQATGRSAVVLAPEVFEANPPLGDPVTAEQPTGPQRPAGQPVEAERVA
jgi:hypothetical protein